MSSVSNVLRSTVSIICLGPLAALAFGGVPAGIQQTQFEFAGPDGMTVRIGDAGAAYRLGACRTFTVPARHNLAQGCTYGLTLRDIPGHSGMQLSAALQVLAPTERVAEVLNRDLVPVSIVGEDLEKVLGGEAVTKVMYIAAPEFRELALPVETIVSHRLDVGGDPHVEAMRRGDILAVLRIEPAPAGLVEASAGLPKARICGFARRSLTNNWRQSKWRTSHDCRPRVGVAR